MRRYFKLYFSFLRTALIRELAFRTSFIFNSITSLVEIGISLLGIEILFQNINSIAGWTFEETLLVIGTQRIVHGFYFGLFIHNMAGIQRLVNKGRLDFVLTKPVNSQFLVSTNRFQFYRISHIMSGVIIVVTALKKLGLQITPSNLLLYIFLILNGVLISYCLWFMTVLPAIRFTRLREIHEIFISLFQVTKFPPEIFKGFLRSFLTFVIPLMVIVIFPSKILLGTLSVGFVLWSFGASLILLYLSHRFWNFALKHYTSAGG